MKTILSILFLLFSTVFVINAQSVIAVQNGGTASFYTTLDSAILNAHNGDTLFLPGGTFPLTVPISKRLHLIGVGYSRELNMATYRTLISGNITLENEASNGSLMGFDLGGDIIGGENISNYMVRRCNFSSLSLSGNNTNWTLIENIIYSLGVGGSAVSNCFFFNNIFHNQMFGNAFGFNSTVFINNIFSYNPNNWSPMSITATNSTFENNIFLHYDPVRWISNSVFNNNLFVTTALGSCSECWGMNNIFGQDIFSIFVDVTASSIIVFIGDYHIKETSPGKTGGKNGTEEGAEVGIYGGLYPWKDGGLPPNPHFQLIDVAPKVDAEGNLNVRIKVEAQER